MAGGVRFEERREPDDPWQVRLADGAGHLVGAGILLDDTHVLTCAHVVRPGSAEQSAAAVRVGFDRRPGVAPGEAVIVPECFSPPDTATGHGDVAVLMLSQPVPGQEPIRLRRTWLRRQKVRMFGYPAGVGYGLWVDAEVAGVAAGDQLVQLNVRDAGPRLERGFSGTAVVDDRTGEVIGMVRSLDKASGACWMIPVDTLVENVPFLARYSFGPSTDGGFGDSPRRPVSDAYHRALLRALADWLGSDGRGGVCAVAGGQGSVREDLFSNLVRRPGGVLNSPGDQWAAPGVSPRQTGDQRGVDVAVRAAGKTTEQVSRLLAAGLGGGADPGTNVGDLVTDLGPPAAVVVDSVDAAGQPEALLGWLLDLMARSPRPAVRLLLGFGGQVPDSLRKLVVARLPERTRGAGMSGPRPVSRAFRRCPLAPLPH